MRIALVDPAPPARLPEPYEHLGLGYLSSVLKARGHEVHRISAPLERLSVSRTIDKIIALNARVVGFSPKESFALRTLQIVRGLRARGSQAHVSLGGHFATFNDREILRDYQAVNSIVRGEGEIAFSELIDAIEAARDFKGIRGLSYRQNGGVACNADGDKIRNLDCIPFPDRTNAELVLKQGGLLELAGSRGCYARCSFCSIHSFYRFSDGPEYRQRSVANMVDEIEHLIATFGVRDFKFIDDQFLGPGEKGRQRALDFIAELNARKLQIAFQFSCRVSEVERELFAHLKQAGLKRVFIGVESAHQRGLDTYHKGTTILQNQQAINILDSLDITTIVAFILTDAFTTWEELKCNVGFLTAIKPGVERTGGLLSVEPCLTPHKGTPIYDQLNALNRLKGNYLRGFRYRLTDWRVGLLLHVWKIMEKLFMWLKFILKKIGRAR